MRETIYYQRGMPDPIYDENIVMDIVHKYAPSAQKLSKIDEEGGEARVYVIDNDIILKMQRPQQLRSSTGLEKEILFLNQLEKQTDVRVPRVLGYGKEGTIEYICMTKIQGIKAEKIKLSKDEKTALLFTLGKELRKIHSINQSAIINSGLFPCDAPPDLTERIQRRYLSKVMELKNNADPEKVTTTLEFIKNELKNIIDTDIFYALHVNPYICHILVDEKTHAYNGLIDFGDAYIGHPIFDMWYWKVESREKLIQGYTSERPVSPAFQIIFDTLNAISKRVSSPLYWEN